MRVFPLLTGGGRNGHEAVFVDRYDELRRWAERLCDGQVHDAEDLLQDAYVEFVRRRPALDSIEDPSAYLRAMLRNLHVSDIRRGSALKRGSRCSVDFDCLELAVAGVDPRSSWDRRMELELLCSFACRRKEESKSASVLILRFFHDYLPGEIASLMRSNRKAVDEWLRLARSEARRFLENPSGTVTVPLDSPAGADLAQQLRRRVFAAASGECLSASEMAALYAPARMDPVGHKALAHMVSCAACLAAATRVAGVAPPEDKLPPGDGTRVLRRPASGKTAVRARLTRALERSRAHRPEALVIAANGFEVSSQVVQAGHNEHTVRPNIGAELGFVELFSEAGVRLLYLEVQPPPEGVLETAAEVELGDGRRAGLRVRFDQPWPEVQAVYDDPEAEETVAAVAEAAPAARRWWRMPAFAMAFLLLVMLGVGAWWMRRPEAMAAPALLAGAEANEQALGARPGRVVHRVLELEDRAPAGRVQRYRMEIWSDAEQRREARKVFDERGELVPAEWTGEPVLRRISTAPWTASLSSREFRALIREFAARATVVTTTRSGEPVYVVQARAANGMLRSAVLYLAKTDLHPLEMVLLMEAADGVHEYRYRETGFSLIDRGSAPDVFRPVTRGGRPAVREPAVAAPTRDEVEAEAWYRMHRAGACTGEQAGIEWRGDGRLEVRAVVSGAARRAEIERAMAGLEGVALALTVGDGEGGAARTGANPAWLRARRAELKKMPAYPLLLARFGDGEEKMLEFADAVVGASDRALAQAWALDRLLDWMSGKTLAGRARAQADEMIRAHAREFRAAASGLRESLELLVPAGTVEAAPAMEENVKILLKAVSRQNAAIHAAFLAQEGAAAPDGSWAAAWRGFERRALWLEQRGLDEAQTAAHRR